MESTNALSNGTVPTDYGHLFPNWGFATQPPVPIQNCNRYYLRNGYMNFLIYLRYVSSTLLRMRNRCVPKHPVNDFAIFVYEILQEMIVCIEVTSVYV